MSALTNLFTAMANKIRSKTGTATTYTPSEMVSDGIDDVYDAGVASVPTPTSITPSNASPVSLTANTAVKPTASGYAIENYSSITPSNSSPVSLTANTIVKPLTIGRAILGYTDLTPSNTDPVQLPLLPPPNQPPIYRLRASGYAISSYSNKTPSPTNRSYSSLSSGTINKISTREGYLYGAIPTGRNLFSFTGTMSYTTSWTKKDLTNTAYDTDADVYATLLDENFAHLSGGEIVVDRACTAYVAGVAWVGRTSNGTAVYSGVRLLKNGTVISGASAYGSSSEQSPGFRRVQVDLAVSDVLQLQTRASSATTATGRVTINLTTA